MQRLSGKSKLVFLTSLVIGLGGPLALWLLAPWQPNRWLANRLLVHLRNAQGEQIDWYATQLAAMDAPGWDVLLATVQDRDRPELQLAAQRVLVDTVRSWRELSADDSAPKVAGMANLLAQRVTTADAPALCFYADLAERLLDWPGSSRDATGRVYNCEQVVRAARKVGWPLRPPDDPAVQPFNAAVPSNTEVAHLSDVPESDTSKLTETTESTTATISDLPSSESVADGQFSDQPPAAGDVSSIVPMMLESPQPPQLEIQVKQEAGNDPPGPPQRTWESAELMELVRALRDPQLAGEAEAELRRRKFNAVNLRVARAASDPSADNRLKLVNLVPELVGIDAIGWLMLLAKDESPRVRFAAVQLLSTTNDPRVLRRLQELDETETDDQIRTVLRKAQTVVR